MKLGTKSILFGAHQFLLHPLFVAIAYIRLYGFPFDPRIWIAFLVHDWGYWGKSDIDGKEGKNHPEFGARIMHFLFDDSIGAYYSAEFGNLIIKEKDWYDFTLYHSRHYAQKDNQQMSKLCYADKLSFCLTPMWLYLICVNLTEEIHEYMDNQQNALMMREHTLSNQILWYKSLDNYMQSWILNNNFYKQ